MCGVSKQFFACSKRMIRRGWLARQHVECGSRQRALIERVGQVLFVHQSTPRGVDQERGRLHARQQGAVDHPGVVTGLRTVQCHDVGFLEDDFDRLPAERLVRRRVGRIGHRRPTPPCPGRGPIHRLFCRCGRIRRCRSVSRQFGQAGFPETEVAALLPLAFANQAVVQRRLVAKMQQHGQHMLRDTVRAVLGNIGDGDAARTCRGRVDNVVARGQDGNEPQSRQLGERGGRQGSLVGQHDVRIGGPLARSGRAAFARRPPGRPGRDRRPGIVTGIQCVSIEHDNTHGRHLVDAILATSMIDQYNLGPDAAVDRITAVVG